MDKEKQTKPLGMFISGQGGVGKSFIVRTLRLWAKQFYRSENVTIAVGAPTGIAAFNVNGMTLHRLFALPVQHGSEAEYQTMRTDELKLMRILYRDLKLLIIDEISMVSNLNLAYVHKRLCETFNTDFETPFGGVNVIVMGDLTQLPPVKASPVYLPITGNDLRKKLGGMGEKLNFWEDVINEYQELTESVRHKDDPEYAELLERVRYGKMTKNDIKRLQSKLLPLRESDSPDEMLAKIADEYEKLKEQDPSTVCLLSKLKMVSRFNDCLLARQKQPIFTIVASDKASGYRSQAMLKAAMVSLKKRNEKISDTAGVGAVLKLCIGARVMLRRNMSGDGFVNGALGEIVDFEWEKPNQTVRFLHIRFDHDRENVVKIGRIRVDFKINKYVTIMRDQFPLILAYSMTFYKGQGMTFSQVMLDIGNTIFGRGGMSYVGLSRLRKLRGLTLLNFDPRKVKCDPRCIDEINRLRGPNGNALNKECAKHRSIPDRMWYCSSESEQKRMSKNSKKKDSRKRRSDADANFRPQVVPANAKSNLKRKGSWCDETKSAKKQKHVAEKRKADVIACAAPNMDAADTSSKDEWVVECRTPGKLIFKKKANPPGLVNADGVSCYANSAFHALMSVDTFREQCTWLEQNVNDVEHIRRLTELFRQYETAEKGSGVGALTTVPLRKELAKYDAQCIFMIERQQQCAREFLDKLLAAVGMSSLFHVELRTRCSCDHGHEWLVGNARTESFMSIYPKEGESLEDLLKAKSRVTTGTVSSVFSTQEIVPNGEPPHLMVWLSRYMLRRVNSAAISNVNTECVRISGRQYRIVAAIAHIGNNYRSGHYVTYVSRNNKWWKCDDACITPADGPPSGLQNISYLILDRLPISI